MVFSWPAAIALAEQGAQVANRGPGPLRLAARLVSGHSAVIACSIYVPSEWPDSRRAGPSVWALFMGLAAPTYGSTL